MRVHLFLIVAAIFALNSCDPYDTRLTVVNGTTDTVFFILSNDGTFEKYPVWIDSAAQDTLWTHTDFVRPNDEISIASMGKNSWEKSISKNYKDSTLILFVFEKQLLKTISQDSLITNQLYSRKYSYKIKDLENLNWRIKYEQ